jgi:hypothetical protein
MIIYVLTLVAAPAAVAMVDFVGAIQLWFKHDESHGEPCDDFVIMVPIFNSMRFLKNAEYLAQYSEHVVLCTTTHESAAFYRAIDRTCKKYGFRQHRSELDLHGNSNNIVRNPWKIFHHILNHAEYKKVIAEEGREALLIENTVAIEAKYAIFLDGDTVSETDLAKVVGDFRERGYDLASVRILPSRAATVAEHMQQIEYRLAMDARKLYPWLTSGACMIARTDVLQHALRSHSHFFQGGDIEIGKLSRMLGYNVGHIDTEFRTVVPSSTRAWFRQRVAWSSGDFRHAIVNCCSYSWRHPFFFFYFTVVVYGMLPLRIWTAIEHPLVLPVVIFVYWVLLFVFRWKYRGWQLFVLPFFGLLNALVITPLGVFVYFQTVWRQRNPGFIRLRAEPRRTFLARILYAEE